MMRVALIAGTVLLLLAGAAQSARSTAPSNTSPPTISGTAQIGEPLIASPGSWSGSDPKSYLYQWLRCDTNGNNCVIRSPFKTKAALGLDVVDSNHRFRVTVMATNSDGSATATSAPSAIVSEGSPLNTSRPTISGTPMEGQTLTATAGTWSGPGPISFEYMWRRCKHADGTGCEDVSVGQTLVLTSLDVGRWMIMQVGARNSKGRGTAKSAPTAAIAPKGSLPASPPPSPPASLPALRTPPVISGIAREGEVLTAAPGTWANAPTSFEYTWNRCDVDGNNCLGFATGTQVKLTVTDVGHRIRLFVEAKNSSGSTKSSSAPTAVVVRVTAPSAPAAPKTPTATALPAGAIKLSSGEISLPVSMIARPERLLISRVRFTPTRIVGRHAFVGRFRVTDTRGYVVRGALVYAIGMPQGWLRTVREVPTGRNGWAQITFRPKRAMPRRRATLFLYLRARKPGVSPLAGVSSRRLVQIKIG
jgi:hypothetical protein